MLSIIICTVNPDNISRLKQSIAATTKYDNEQIIYQNIHNYGLCQVYNECASKAKNDFLCFVHDDINFHTLGWDEKVINYLQNEQIGVVGVMGGRYQSYFGGGWRNGKTSAYRVNIIDPKSGQQIYNPDNKGSDEVFSLDGAFLCCRKQNWRQHPFDHRTFKGFHFYDIDFSLKMHFSGLKNLVVFDIVLEHLSQGKKNFDFFIAFIHFQKKWKKILPRNLDASVDNHYALEGYALAETLSAMKAAKFPKYDRWRQLQAYNRMYKSVYHFIRCAYFGFVK